MTLWPPRNVPYICIKILYLLSDWVWEHIWLVIKYSFIRFSKSPSNCSHPLLPSSLSLSLTSLPPPFFCLTDPTWFLLYDSFTITCSLSAAEALHDCGTVTPINLHPGCYSKNDWIQAATLLACICSLSPVGSSDLFTLCATLSVSSCMPHFFLYFILHFSIPSLML